MEREWIEVLDRALAEDRAGDDLTTKLLGDAVDRMATGTFVAQGDFVVAGLRLAGEVFRRLDETSDLRLEVDDGQAVARSTVLAGVTAPARTLLAGERVALNFLQHLSGVATRTRRAVDAVREHGADVTDTRKTLPGLRALEKYAVRAGGGVNNRPSLAGAVFFKDNHWAVMRAAGRTLAETLAGVPQGTHVVVEVDTESELREALKAGARHILADNTTPQQLRGWIAEAGKEVVFEASGGITPERAGEYAAAGARFVSIGAITHSAPAAPIGFELQL